MHRQSLRNGRLQRHTLGLGYARADGVRRHYQRAAILASTQIGLHRAQHVSGIAVRDDRLQTITHFQAGAAIADRQQQQSAVVFSLLPDAPFAKERVGGIFNWLAIERWHSNQCQLRSGSTLEIGAVLFQLLPAGRIDYAREIANIALRLERREIDGKRCLGA